MGSVDNAACHTLPDHHSQITTPRSPRSDQIAASPVPEVVVIPDRLDLLVAAPKQHLDKTHRRGRLLDPLLPRRRLLRLTLPTAAAAAALVGLLALPLALVAGGGAGGGRCSRHEALEEAAGDARREEEQLLVFLAAAQGRVGERAMKQPQRRQLWEEERAAQATATSTGSQFLIRQGHNS